MKMFKDIVIIPTYNERDGIGKIIQRVAGLYPDMEIWVVDDNSPDGTAGIVSAIASDNPNIKLIVRASKTGLGDAYKETLTKIQTLEYVRNIVTIDSDGSHDPVKIKDLLSALDTHDLSIGSRYVKGGGGMVGIDMFRSLLSRGGNLYARIIIGFPLHDSTAGFVAFRRQALSGLNIASISSSGYAYQIEFKNMLLEAGRSFVEIPITFINREDGASKMSNKIILEGIISPWKIRARRIFNAIFGKLTLPPLV